ncbi:hybrid sensor histidine kinase/response regulator [Aquabacterium humicola]|uniref:hybrid sensor histidine kinase/response regulator n=1 Tax=Aquabacterium humicola TaxID=3237377 RepID=UPI002542728A|nr:PAS domain-containing hybrid sensor histidine kinase/response regulator [Rubrivivax pictus]
MSMPDQRVLAAPRRLVWLLGLPLLVLLAVLSAVQYRQRIGAAEQALLLRLQQRAQELEQLARPAVDHVHDLRAMLQAQWHAPPDAGPALRQALSPRSFAGRPDGWSLDAAPAAARERFGQVWWAEPDGRPMPESWVQRAAAFVQQARIAHQRAPGFEATWFAGVDVNTSFGYPYLPAERIVQALGSDGLTGIAPIRVKASASSRDWLRRHAPRTTWWGAPDVSQLHGQLVVSHGAMLIVAGDYVGEVSVDFRLDALQQRVADWSRADGARHWIVSAMQRDGGAAGSGGVGEVMADSAAPLQPPGQPWAPGADRPKLAVALAEHLPAGLPVTAARNALHEPGRVQRDGGWLFAGAARDGAPWATLVALPEATLRAQVLASLAPNALLAAALLLTFVAGQWLLSRRMIAPALDVLAYLRALSVDAGARPPALPARWRGWVDAVTLTFRAQRASHQREAFNSAIVDHALAAIVATDAAGRILEFNPAASAMFGLPREQALGRRVTTLFPERFRAEHEAGLLQLVAGRRADFIGRRVEIVALHGDGREFPVEMLLWRTELDGEVHFTASMVDLTERRAAQHEIERQREALRQSEKLGAMGGLLAGVAHELNNPLAVVMGRAGLLEEKLGDAAAGDDPASRDALRDDAARIREAAERCGRIVRTFLNMARSRPAQRGAVNLNELARAAAEMLAYTWRSHDIELQLDLHPALPRVQADADQIGQVVLNLLINAQQAIAAQALPRRVIVSSGVEAPRADRSPHAWLRVVDNGPGVPEAAQAQIFEPFFTTKAEGIGTGLGLAVSRSLARAHGGELRLERTTGGACFRLSLPLDAAPAAEAAAPPVATDAAADAPALARILVVDDEADIAGLMRDMLESAGYEVTTAESGAVALEMLSMAAFDAVISDLRMPDMDGSALWRALREQHPALARRVLFVTGDTLSTGARRFLDETGCAGLDKPFAKADLLRAVAALLDAGDASIQG